VKLESIKENGGKRTLMHYIAYVCENNYPDLLKFTLDKAEAASTISITETNKDLRNLTQSVRIVKKELDADHSEKHDRFTKVFGTFELKASKLVAELDTEFNQILEEFQKLTTRFGENKKIEPENFFSIFVRFRAMVQRAYEDILAQRSREAKAKKMEEEKQKRITLKKKRDAERAAAASASEGVVDAFKKAQKGSADAILKGYQERHKNQKDNDDDDSELKGGSSELRRKLMNRKKKAQGLE